MWRKYAEIVYENIFTYVKSKELIIMRTIKKRLVSIMISLSLVTGIMQAGSITANSVGSVPEGFVYTKGTQFMMDRNTYYYGGTNCYYLTYKSKSTVQNVLNDASDMGLNVIRIWGHLDVGKMTDEKLDDGVTPVFEGNNDNNGGVATKDGVYFQYWDAEQNRPVVNEGENGLRKLDYVISEAEKRGIKLIITFTNYWEAFGGMGQYVKYYQMLNGETPENNRLDETQVCEFYTNETIKQWYKDYINTLVNHTNYYTGEKLKESEAVFAWELSNEPRCTVDGDWDTFCKDNILYNWVTEMSSYVKSIDPNHMVSIGDEGFYNMGYQQANNQNLPSSAYSGYYGVDFEKLMTIDTIDFGTPHMYVDQWGFKEGDDLEWIKRHAQTAHDAGKPVILEEFGLTNKETRDAHYSDWLSIITGDYYDGIEYEGFNYWMIASWIDEPQQSAFGDGRYYYSDYDQYTVYGPKEIEDKVGSPEARNLIVAAAAKMNAKNINNTAEISTDTVDRSNVVNVAADLNVMLGQFDGVTCDGIALSNGTDYSVNGNVVTIDKDYFKTLELGNHAFKFVFTEGNNPTFEIQVTDSNVIDAELSSYTLDIDKSPYVLEDVSIDMTLNDNEFRGIKNGKNVLVEGTDYTVSGNTVTLKAEYISSLAKGENILTFDFYEGNDRELTLNISDSSTRIWEGSFNIGNWTNSLKIDKNLKEWASGDLLFTLQNANDCQLQLNYVDSEGSVKKIIDYTNAFSGNEYTMKLSAEQFEKLRTAKAIVVKGKNAVIKAIDIENGVRATDYIPDDSSSIDDDSSSQPDSSSQQSSDDNSYVVYNDSFDLNSWNSELSLDLSDFTSVSKVVITMSGNGQVQFNYTGYTNVNGGDHEFTDVADFAGKVVPVKGTGTITKITVFGTKAGNDESSEIDSSSTPDDTSSEVDSSSEVIDDSSDTDLSSDSTDDSSETDSQSTVKYQLRANDDGSTDVRFILIADEQGVLVADSASVYATIDGTDTDVLVIKRAYRSIKASGKTITADEGKVFLIGKFIGIPDDMVDGMVGHFTLGENTYDRTIMR